jgi:hypothetical protein
MRFNFYGGAGSGKSTAAAWTFSHMKTAGYNVELVLEYIKTWAYLNRNVKSFDQVYILSKQLHAEDRLIYSGVKNLVTDCPIDLSYIYSTFYQNPKEISEPLKTIADYFDNQFPSVNIFLKREDKEYKQEGRYQSLEEAKVIDDYILKILYWKEKETHVIPHNDRSSLKKIVEEYAD